MEESVKTVLDYINKTISGVFFNIDGKALSFSYNKDNNNYTMRNGTKSQEISLNELLVLLNRPELKEPVEEEAKKIKEKEEYLSGLREKYLKDIEELDVPEEEKQRLRLLVRQMALSSDIVGNGNRVTVVDAELEKRRDDYFEHEKEYDTKKKNLLEEIGKIDKKLKWATDEEQKVLMEEQEKKWEEVMDIPVAPDILSYHFRLEGDDITLVTSLDANINFHSYKKMTMEEVAEFIKDKELKLDEELVQMVEGEERE